MINLPRPDFRVVPKWVPRRARRFRYGLRWFAIPEQIRPGLSLRPAATRGRGAQSTDLGRGGRAGHHRRRRLSRSRLQSQLKFALVEFLGPMGTMQFQGESKPGIPRRVTSAEGTMHRVVVPALRRYTGPEFGRRIPAEGAPNLQSADVRQPRAGYPGRSFKRADIAAI